MAKVNIGKMACETRGCDNVVTIKEAENGTLSYRCDECDAAPYAKTGTGQNALWRRNITPKVTAPQPEEKQEKNPQPAKEKQVPEQKPAKAENVWGF